MTTSRLYKVSTGTFSASPPKVTLRFPPVPQGQVWTGSIAVSPPSGQDLQGIVWTLYRDGNPFLSWQEYGVASDVQAISHEGINLVGVYLGTAASVPLFPITATWTGYAQDVMEAPYLSPKVTGATRALVDVWNSPGGVGAPLAVVDAPSNVNTSLTRLSGASQSALMLPVPTPGSGVAYTLWELGLQVTAGQSPSDTTVQWLTASIQQTNPTVNLVQCQVTTAPGQGASEYVRLPLHGFQLSSTQTIQVTTGSYPGANANAYATVVYN